MIDIDNKILHFDIFKKNFCCNIKKCKGQCCIEGDLGAPIEEEEIKIIEKNFFKIKKNLSAEALYIINKNGFFVNNPDGEFTISLCENSEICVFAQTTNENIIYCVLENAYNEGIIDFKKPISCHLYPIRIKKYKTMETINYHEWNICEDAVTLGNELNIKIIDFLKEPLIKKYGEKWYEEAMIAKQFLNER